MDQREEVSSSCYSFDADWSTMKNVFLISEIGVDLELTFDYRNTAHPSYIYEQCLFFGGEETSYCDYWVWMGWIQVVTVIGSILL